MDDDKILSKETYIFGSLFLLSNRLQVIIDRDFAKYSITTKQWFLMAVMGEFFKEAPTLKEIADFMGSSHQNVKQLALKLEKNGLMNLEKDKYDKRITRLSLTEKSFKFWEDRRDIDVQFFKKLFESFNESEIEGLYAGLDKLTKAVSEI